MHDGSNPLGGPFVLEQWISLGVAVGWGVVGFTAGEDDTGNSDGLTVRNIPMRLDVQVATPQPKKSVSSIQIGHASANAAARIGQSSGSRCPRRSRATDSNSPYDSIRICSVKRLNPRNNANAFSGSPPRLMTSAGKFSSASAYAISGTKYVKSSQCVSMMLRTRVPRTARTRILASRTSALPEMPLLFAG